VVPALVEVPKVSADLVVLQTRNPQAVDTGALNAPEVAQWSAGFQQEVTALGAEAAQAPTIAANYAQAGIHATVASALPPSNAQDILNDPLAHAAEQQMVANYAATG